MSSSFKFKINTKGVGAFLKSEPVKNMISERANEIASRAGTGYEADTQIGQKRATGRVKAATAKAKKDNKKHNTLLKAVRG